MQGIETKKKDKTLITNKIQNQRKINKTAATNVKRRGRRKGQKK